MSNASLTAYLNDHLAGSVGAIEMVARAIEQNAGTPFARRLEGVLEEIKSEQQVLKDLIAGIGGEQNPVKKAGAWLAEKASRMKLGGTDDPAGLARLEVLEALTIGIHGRSALWRALRVVVDKHPELRSLDLDLLERRAIEQRDRVEEWRLEAASEAL